MSVFTATWALLFLLSQTAGVSAADFLYVTNNNKIIITQYTGTGGAVTIPKTIDGLPVTEIYSYAFGARNDLTSVSIPESVTTIRPGAFVSCTNLTTIGVDDLNSVYRGMEGVLFNKNETTLLAYPGGKAGGYTIPGSVTRIEKYAFAGCAKLTSVVIPENVTTVGESVFLNCGALASVTIRGRIPSITLEMFRNCSSLTGVVLPDSLKNIEGSAFYACSSLTNITIPKSVVAIEGWAFAECAHLSSISIPYGVTVLGATFANCWSLKSVTIPDSVSYIGNDTFSGCRELASITIPSSVKEIKSFAFYQCSNLRGIYFAGNAPRVDYFALSCNIYYLPGTTGWGSTWGNCPTFLWNPTIPASDPNFGVRGGQFRFTVNGTPEIVVVIEANTDLNSPNWTPVSTNTLVAGTSNFIDTQSTAHSIRHYRLRSP